VTALADEADATGNTDPMERELAGGDLLGDATPYTCRPPCVTASAPRSAATSTTAP
jgi:hypothetical protein